MATAIPTSHPPHTESAYAIIVAGGSGTRMQSAIPKQFLLLDGKPVLMHTIDAFYSTAFTPAIILVLPADYHSYWEQLCTTYNFKTPHQLVTGGATRFHSVKNGLEIIPDNTNTLIAVHDAVRPLISKDIIEKSYFHAAEHGNAVTAIKSRDSVRLHENGISKSLIRDDVYLVQTPQTFKSEQIKNAYLQSFSTKFTDDASVVEETGLKINLVEGSYQNIKITFPEDIAIAEMILKSR
ncbi:2-C-methyl-D-erythritol 4-phosphate cytidylyltransferase [Mucilaginibacter xinganensis]|uniref:2-C-methyl-D-erythritol 4-phosphate cytidylyltransferase n=1 Tax=Mucilaginibacter xinganensis TaxID=1234841 RepID=A0A223NVD1_9SPHI|nr:2-C-methyl-D-erythritol 4-phosphate cytidylyltransferase [Mucilaginibacter xinganensis]ASU33817.1 2-C-methyl-D-erythritol 4-phosphate cytidylyltransferase [Mucilaginibacter xinganensis]